MPSLGSFSSPVRAGDLAFPVSNHLEIHVFLKIYSPLLLESPFLTLRLVIYRDKAEKRLEGDRHPGWTSGLGGHCEES